MSDGLSGHHAVINKTSWLRLEQRKSAVGRSEARRQLEGGVGVETWDGWEGTRQC